MEATPSIIGRFKPRVRQPSILKMVRNTEIETALTSPISSPPVSSSPPTPQQNPQAKKPKPAPRHVTTAQLQNLLPKRRLRQKKQYDTFEIHSSPPAATDEEDDEEDVDELQRPAKRRHDAQRKGKGKRQPVKQRGVAVVKQVHSSPGRGKAARNPKSGAKRTYGARTTEDKENEDAEASECEVDEANSADSDSDLVAVASTKRAGTPKSDELLAAKEKFQEVDQWELEFESTDLAGGSSSPWR